MRYKVGDTVLVKSMFFEDYEWEEDASGRVVPRVISRDIAESEYRRAVIVTEFHSSYNQDIYYIVQDEKGYQECIHSDYVFPLDDEEYGN